MVLREYVALLGFPSWRDFSFTLSQGVPTEMQGVLSVMKKLFLLALPVLLVGCSTKVGFTPNLVSEYNLDGEALQDLQFYTSDQIVLTRSVVSEATGKACHSLNLVRDRSVEVVTIRKNTPARVTQVGPNSFRVSFEDGGELNFTSALHTARVPYKEHTTSETTAQYQVYRLTRDGQYEPTPGNYYDYGPHMYMYNGKEYASFNYRDVYLTVNRKTVERLAKTRRNAPGNRFADLCSPCCQ
jgi:hypothetical protein